MGISWVAGTTPTYSASSSSLNSTTPAGIQDDDGLFCFVRTSGDVSMTPPAGWTQLGTETAAAGAGYSKVWVFRKDTVTSGNSSTVYTWTPGAATQIAVTYAVVRATATVMVHSLAFRKLENVSDGVAAVYLPQTTSARNGNMFLMLGASYWTLGGNQTISIVNAGSDATMWTGSYNLNLFAGAYSVRNEGQLPKTGSSEWYFPFVAGTNNGRIGIVLELRDTAVEASINETTTLMPYTGQGSPVYDSLTDGVTQTDTSAILRRTSNATEDGTIWLALIYGLRATYGVVSETASVTPVASVFPKWGGTARDTVTIDDVQTVLWKLRIALSDGVSFREALAAARAVLATDTVSVTEAMALVRGVRLLEALRVGDTALPRTSYRMALLEALLLDDGLRRFASGVAADTVTLTAAAASLRRTPGALTDTSTLTDALAAKLILRLTLQDDVTLDDADVLKLIYAGRLADEIEISAGYIQPNGAFTSWAVNTRSAAVTEYTGFEFNSFARLGNRYLGANSTGLYVLDGDTDQGTSIIADIKTGFAQFAGSRYSSIKAIYLGMRGSGEFVLRVTEGDGTVRAYKVLTQNMKTAKVQTGKGIRARYLAFELVSTGQDFDLDTIEVVPLMADRRV